METPLDTIDRQILAALQADGRLSGRALAEQVGISRANAYARFDRLVADGVITGFTALVDPAKVGLTTSAYVTLTVRQSSWRDLQERLRAIPRGTAHGPDRRRVRRDAVDQAADNDALRRVVLEQLQAIPGVLATRTFLIFEDAGN